MLVGMTNAGKIVFKAQIDNKGLTNTKMINRRPMAAKVRGFILLRVYRNL
jgi:hypothetical protein